LRSDGAVDAVLGYMVYPRAPSVCFGKGRGWGAYGPAGRGPRFEAASRVNDDGMLTTHHLRIPFYQAGVQVCVLWEGLREDLQGALRDAGNPAAAIDNGALWLSERESLSLDFAGPLLRSRAEAVRQGLLASIEYDGLVAELERVATINLSKAAADYDRIPEAPPGLADLLRQVGASLKEFSNLASQIDPDAPIFVPLSEGLLAVFYEKYDERLVGIQERVEKALAEAERLELDGGSV
jgi:hypothetical protein